MRKFGNGEEYITFYDNGNPREQLSYKNRFPKEREYKAWCENGELFERKIYNDQITKCDDFYPNGNVCSQIIFDQLGVVRKIAHWKANGFPKWQALYDGNMKMEKRWGKIGRLLSYKNYKCEEYHGEVIISNKKSNRKFYWFGTCMDDNFTTDKKITLLKFKNKLRSSSFQTRYFPKLSTFLISDLLLLNLQYLQR